MKQSGHGQRPSALSAAMSILVSARQPTAVIYTRVSNILLRIVSNVSRKTRKDQSYDEIPALDLHAILVRLHKVLIKQQLLPHFMHKLTL